MTVEKNYILEREGKHYCVVCADDLNFVIAPCELYKSQNNNIKIEGCAVLFVGLECYNNSGIFTLAQMGFTVIKK